MRNRLSIAVAAFLIAAVPFPGSAMGYGPFPAFAGSNLPATGSVFASVAIGQYGVQPYKLGYYLDDTGDTMADVADVANSLGATDGIGSLLGAYVSPSDPKVVYVLYAPQSGGVLSIVSLRRVGDTWTRIGNPMPYPLELAQFATGTWNVVNARILFPQFISSWTNIIGVRRLVNGSDALLVTATKLSSGHVQSRFALLVDGSDADPFADHWSSVEEVSDIEPMTLDEDGGILARHDHLVAPADGTDQLLRLLPRDDDDDGVPETPNIVDESTRVSVGFTGAGASCWGDVDFGTGRFFFGPLVGTLNLDSHGAPIQGTVRPYEDVRVGAIPWFTQQVLLDPSGTPYGYARSNTGRIALVRSIDLNFDGLVGNNFETPVEVIPAIFEDQLPNPYIVNASVAKAREVALVSGATVCRFSDFGDSSSSQAFRFRFGSQDYDSVWVSANGLVSFVGPIDGSSTSSGLAALHGVIAPAWSTRWDTSQVRVYAGYAPAETSFRDGSPVLAFSIEFRGLRDPLWELGRSFSMRLLLYSDGTFRTDYGAIDEAGAPFVVGYSGPGSSSSAITSNPADHSWGSTPAGTGSERVASDEFTSTNSLGHIETRWFGYPERTDTAGPAPMVAGLKLKAGKLAFTAAGSNVEDGARLVVDGAEAFTLKLNAAGTKWVVSKKARSIPDAVTIAAVLAGTGHTVVVVNPDGTLSDAATL